MNLVELDRIQDAFKNALLYQKTDKISSLRKEMEKVLSADDLNKFLENAEEWKKQSFALGEKAVTLAKNGKKRDSLEFDELKAEAKSLGGNILAFLYQKLDQTVIECEDKALEEKQIASDNEKKSKKFLLGEITRLSTWGKRGKEQLRHCLEEIRKFYPEAVTDAERRKARGEKLVQYKTTAVHLNPAQLADLLKKMEGDGFSPYEISIVRKMKDKIELTKKIGKKSDVRKTVVLQTPNEQEFTASFHEVFFGNVHKNSIPELPATTEWTILFDETGTDFRESAFGENVSDISLGRMIALVVPDYTNLPPCKEACHSVDLLLSDVYKMEQILLSHKCGIIGIPVNALYRIHAEQWFSCIETLLDLILRLLPVNGKTKLKIYVEQRKEASAEKDYLLKKTCNDCLYHLSRAFPERSQAFELESHIIRKEDHPWNGYVDAVAFCWSSPNGKMILNESGWEHSCLIDSSPYFLRHCIDVMEREENINPNDWNELLKKTYSHTNSLEKALLMNAGERAKQTPSVWKTYLEYAVQHLDSKAIDMELLGNQVNWLSQYAPTESELPPRLRLLWLTAKLAEENHRGCIATHLKQREEFVRLSEELFEEDAPLTCNAALNLAVSYTDEYEFNKAQKILAPWQERRPEVPGLQYYGRLLSSYGQHKAFLGRNAEAIPYFKQAIETFGKLSDKGCAVLDILQTSAYLLTVMMDNLPNSANEFCAEAEKYFHGKITDIAPLLGESVEDNRKYQHHILLRYLTGNSAAAEERSAYLRSAGKWNVGTGHPWEMIEFYRALLIDNPSEKLKHLQKAYAIAMAGDGTMHVIAAVILGSILLMLPEKEKEYLDLVEHCAAEIPALGERLNIMRNHVQCKYSPLELAALILPFNFR